ncbi:MAG: nucleotidyltransferase domain-containing protein [Paludibacter sp.]|nr:nucleotidyltransferase domain-containing protein [Paludibacter sp.]
MGKKEILDYLKNNKQQLKDNYHLIKIGLFGSFAKDIQNPESDIDLLIEFEPGTQNISEKKEKLKKILKIQFDRDVDLCREKYLKPYMKEFIIQETIYV